MLSPDGLNFSSVRIQHAHDQLFLVGAGVPEGGVDDRIVHDCDQILLVHERGQFTLAMCFGVGFGEIFPSSISERSAGSFDSAIDGLPLRTAASVSFAMRTLRSNATGSRVENNCRSLAALVASRKPEASSRSHRVAGVEYRLITWDPARIFAAKLYLHCTDENRADDD